MTKSAIFYLAISLIFAATSCGTRKTSTKRVELQHDSIEIHNTVKLAQSIRLNDIGTVRPFDSSKTLIINGVSYYNAVLSFDRSRIIDSKLEGSENLSYTSDKSKNYEKQTEKTDHSNTYVGLFFVFCVFVFAYFKKWF